MPLEPGTRLGPYEIVAPLGSGGMGEVYKALDTRLNRTVAIKVLPRDLALGDEARQRFEREARTISQLSHPNICVLYDVGHQDGIEFLVMELLEGETLASRLSRGRLATDRALEIAIAVCDALTRAHQQGVVHRDIKPGNIMLTRGGAKLLDFGLARQDGAMGVDRAATIANTAAASVPLTTRGSIVGTVQYMAPEQVEGRAADARSDIWALGCVLYEMLSGSPAFRGTSAASVMAAILQNDPAPLNASADRVPPALDRVVRTCLEKDPADRWQSARDLLRELRWAAEELRVGNRNSGETQVQAPGRRRRWAWAASLLTLVVALAVVSGSRWLTPARGPATPVGPRVIVLMDSTHPLRVYDDETRRAGGTNADDLTDLLRDLPVLIAKENTSVNWHREEEVVRQRPELIVVHRSCFYDQTLLGQLDESLRLAPLAWDKLELFLGYVGVGSPRTKFLVYSRRGWESPEAARAWVQSVEGRFPALRGRVHAWRVPLSRPTFRNPDTGAEIRDEILQVLGLRPGTR